MASMRRRRRHLHEVALHQADRLMQQTLPISYLTTNPVHIYFEESQTILKIIDRHYKR